MKCIRLSSLKKIGSTAACTIQLATGACRERDMIKGNSYFGQVKVAKELKESYGINFNYIVKSGYAGYPREYLETTMKDCRLEQAWCFVAVMEIEMLLQLVTSTIAKPLLASFVRMERTALPMTFHTNPSTDLHMETMQHMISVVQKHALLSTKLQT